MSRLIQVLVLIAVTSDAGASNCAFVDWSKYLSTPLRKHPTVPAYIFETAKVKVDADGAPNAYHPQDVGLHCIKGKGFKGLDCPANAGYPKEDWWPSAIVPDPADPKHGYVQPATAPFPGYLVSQTSLQDETKIATDPSKYVDSRSVPYIVFPGKFYKMAGTGVMGDFGYAINRKTGTSSAFIVAETGPSGAELGEMSIALATALGGVSPNPRTGSGTPAGPIIFVIFPRSHSSPKWPLSLEEIGARAAKLVDSAGGKTALEGCGKGM